MEPNDSLLNPRCEFESEGRKGKHYRLEHVSPRLVTMKAAERFVKVCGEIGNYTEKLTGVNVVDAYTGPDELHPEKQSKERTPSELVHEIQQTFDLMRDEIDDPLRLEYMMGELHSLNVVIDWLADKDMSYSELVEGLFHIAMKRFPESSSILLSSTGRGLDWS